VIRASKSPAGRFTTRFVRPIADALPFETSDVSTSRLKRFNAPRVSGVACTLP
jgi:hypothetical protein